MDFSRIPWGRGSASTGHCHRETKASRCVSLQKEKQKREKRKKEKEEGWKKRREKKRWSTRRILGAQADVEQKLLPQKVGKGRSGIVKKLSDGLEVVLPQVGSPTD